MKPCHRKLWPRSTTFVLVHSLICLFCTLACWFWLPCWLLGCTVFGLRGIDSEWSFFCFNLQSELFAEFTGVVQKSRERGRFWVICSHREKWHMASVSCPRYKGLSKGEYYVYTPSKTGTSAPTYFMQHFEVIILQNMAFTLQLLRFHFHGLQYLVWRGWVLICVLGQTQNREYSWFFAWGYSWQCLEAYSVEASLQAHS